MPTSWSKDELQDILEHATPIVRKFLKGLTDRGCATVGEIGVSHMAAAIGHRYAKHRGKEPLYKSAKDGTTGRSVFSIEAKYREDIGRILSDLPDQPSEFVAMKRRPGMPRSIEALSPKRSRRRARKIDIAVET